MAFAVGSFKPDNVLERHPHKFAYLIWPTKSCSKVLILADLEMSFQVSVRFEDLMAYISLNGVLRYIYI